MFLLIVFKEFHKIAMGICCTIEGKTQRYYYFSLGRFYSSTAQCSRKSFTMSWNTKIDKTFLLIVYETDSSKNAYFCNVKHRCWIWIWCYLECCPGWVCDQQQQMYAKNCASFHHWGGSNNGHLVFFLFHSPVQWVLLFIEMTWLWLKFKILSMFSGKSIGYMSPKSLVDEKICDQRYPSL